MSVYLIWRRSVGGLKGPSISLLVGSPELNTYDKDNIFPGFKPIELPHQHADLPLAELAKLYPPPPRKEN